MDKINEIWPNWNTVELIGAGSFGKVYKVKREQFGNVTWAAVKVIHIPQEETEMRDLQQSGMDVQSIRSYYEEMIASFMNEIHAMETLKSANNVVAIEDYEVVPRETLGWDIYIRMELLTSFKNYAENKELTVEEILKIGVDICQALVYCHEKNIIHRDIKLDNVFVNTFGSFKLGDFGISKQLEHTRAAMSQKGTNMYMAPEVFRGERYNQSVDIYSLGILLYRLLNKGRFPFMPKAPEPIHYNDQDKAMQKRLSGEKMDCPTLADEKLSSIVLKACQADPSLRYSTAEEFLQELKEYVGEGSGYQKQEELSKGNSKNGTDKEISDEEFLTIDVNWQEDSLVNNKKQETEKTEDDFLANEVTVLEKYGISLRLPKVYRNITYLDSENTLENEKADMLRDGKILQVDWDNESVFMLFMMISNEDIGDYIDYASAHDMCIETKQFGNVHVIGLYINSEGKSKKGYRKKLKKMMNTLEFNHKLELKTKVEQACYMLEDITTWDGDVYYKGEIPLSKGTNAIKKIAQGRCEYSDILLLCDTSIMCSGKSGYIFTHDAMYHKDSEKISFYYDDLISVKLKKMEKSDNKRELEIVYRKDGEEYTKFLVDHCVNKSQLYIFLQTIITCYEMKKERRKREYESN